MNKHCKAILKAFKEANPNLVALSPKIVVDEILGIGGSDYPEPIVYDQPLLQITVQHPYIFDNRLVPDEFKGIKVLNVRVGKAPSEFPEPLTNIPVPLEEHHAPERYIAFVKRKLSAIRKKLGKPDLSEDNALDALTGDFNKHIEWCKNLSLERLENKSHKAL